MSSQTVTAYVVTVCDLAASGVDYSPRYGALCPGCRKRAKIYSTRPWEGAVRVRYHRCMTPGCVINRLGKTIKSVEEDKG